MITARSQHFSGHGGNFSRSDTAILEHFISSEVTFSPRHDFAFWLRQFRFRDLVPLESEFLQVALRGGSWVEFSGRLRLKKRSFSANWLFRTKNVSFNIILHLERSTLICRSLPTFIRNFFFVDLLILFHLWSFAQHTQNSWPRPSWRVMECLDRVTTECSSRKSPVSLGLFL